MKVIAIVQARMGSTRLPGKVLADVHGRPMLQWLLDRVKAVSEIDEIVVATTTNPEDNILETWLNSHGISCFRGSETDVLDRFVRCAESRAPELIVRVTADDPLKDPGIIRQAIAMVRDGDAIDYCSNTVNPTYPEGLDIEVFRYASLVRAHHEAKLPSEREHVTPYIWKHPEIFNLCSLEFHRNLSAWRWTVDKPADLEFVREIYRHFNDNPLVPFTKIIEHIENNPYLAEINAGSIRNEGYFKSLASEKK